MSFIPSKVLLSLAKNMQRGLTEYSRVFNERKSYEDCHQCNSSQSTEVSPHPKRTSIASRCDKNQGSHTRTVSQSMSRSPIVACGLDIVLWGHATRESDAITTGRPIDHYQRSEVADPGSELTARHPRVSCSRIPQILTQYLRHVSGLSS